MPVKRDVVRHDERVPELFDRVFGDRLSFFRRPFVVWPDLEDMRLEEFREDGSLVVRAELAGLDPEKDIEISVANHVLHIEAQRRETQESTGRDYVRREFHYGMMSRDVPLPDGVSDRDVKATYKDGILEVRIPAPATHPAAKVPITT